ncbi:error-prone DNA polymerase [Devosia pacifica]|uniref:Error-prone DNA polymerase n=1 Tax=Devosia pacifica TaxID=1335967 RepID=A0A918S5C7_9HYPH|nr:error-prone DNA polymerase [Devosia pacifica]GHA24039.1 error-prone DNA polymerase [Devosia pacifica]
MSAPIPLPPSRPSRPVAPPAFIELLATSNFSFLRGASHPEEMVSAAAQLGLAGLGLADRNSFAGVVRGYVADRDLEEKPKGFRYLVGVRLCFADGTPDIVAYPSDRAAYGRLCRLLTLANKRGAKGAPELHLSDLLCREGDFIVGQLLILVPDEDDWAKTEDVLTRLAGRVPGNIWLAGFLRFAGNDRARLNRVADLAKRCGVAMLASGDVLYHEPDRSLVQDVVTCIREHMTLEEAGRTLAANAERHLKPPREMARLFAEHPDALAETVRFAARIGFCLDQLRYNYPEETIGNGESAQQTLERLTWRGAARRYPGGVPDKVKRALWMELSLIAYKHYAAYFLTVHDIVIYARYERKILCQGRGSAANSAVCFCLEITEVDPASADLVFGRFISTERDEPPDIDVDFEHERREEVMAYVYAKYGGKRTGLTANVISYRSKSAIRETAKVFGLSEDVVAGLNQLHWGWGQKLDLSSVAQMGLDPNDPVLAQMFAVVGVLRGFPRHLSQHVGGFVITRDSLESLVPIGKSAMDSRTIIEWNKDDIDALGILKVDILALGMLSCLRRGFELLHRHYDTQVELAELLREEKKFPERAAPVYRMTHRADTIGVFQIESRAQMTMLPRLKPREFYDLVIEVAIVRPGPIQGGMVHPYLKRRLGREKVTFPNPDLEAVLGRTLGVPLFQEQAMQIAIVGAGFSAGKADQLRRAMAAWRRNGKIAEFGAEFIAGMIANGYEVEFAKRCFAQIQGFGEYGFPESHAASFALLVYASCWMKCHYPDVFACALLNSQPMGFYAPSQIIRDAIEHGVEVREVDVNLSDLDCVLEENSRPAAEHVRPQHREMREDILSNHAIRLGLGYIKGLKQDHANLLVARRGAGYDSVRDVWLRTGLPVSALEVLANADAFASLGLSRRDTLWAVRGLMGAEGAETLPLFKTSEGGRQSSEPDADLPAMPPGEEVVSDYKALTFSLKGHPVSFLRDQLDRHAVVRAADLLDLQNGKQVTVAGLVLVRQRPGTASGVIFSTLEDETGVANIIIWPRVFEANRRTVLASRMLVVRGELQREGLVVHVVARQMHDLTPRLIAIANGVPLGDAAMSRADEGKSGPHGDRARSRDAIRHEDLARRRAYAALPSGRNFH